MQSNDEKRKKEIQPKWVEISKNGKSRCETMRKMVKNQMKKNSIQPKKEEVAEKKIDCINWAKSFVVIKFYRILSVRERGDEYSFDKPLRCFR